MPLYNSVGIPKAPSGVITIVGIQKAAQFVEATYTSGQITRVSTYSNSGKATELFRKTITYGSNTITVEERDYTITPNNVTTKTVTINAGTNITVGVV